MGKEVTSQISLHLIFPCVIGGLPAYWNGYGGCYEVNLGDGGDLSRVDWCVRPSESIGEFQLLSRDEMTKAIKEGFCWVEEPLEAERIEVTAVQLLAYHGRDDDTQKHFAPLWMLSVRPAGKPDDVVKLCIPALKQHRARYGATPGKN